MNIKKQISTIKGQINKNIHSVWRPVSKQVNSRPLVSFFVSLGVLFGVIFVVNFLNRPQKTEESVEAEAIRVQSFRIGEAPTITVQAKIEKTGLVTIYAQTGGVVQRINVSEGNSIRQGQTVVSLSSTYGGANMATYQRQIAEKSLENSIDTYETQKELIDRRRELAEKTDENADRMRELARETLDRTKDQLDYNQSMLDTVNGQISILEKSNDPSDVETLASLKQVKSQLVAGVNGLKDAVANIEATSDDDDPAARLSDLGKEIALRGLELEEKGLNLGIEIAELNLKIARIGEMLFYPQSPFSGTVERVYVKPGDLVNPGQPLAAVVGGDQSVKAVALVSADIAEKVSKFDTSKLYWDDTSIEQIPQYVASEPTDGNLYAITWCQLDSFAQTLENKEYITVELPVGHADSGGTIPYLPLDSIYQTQDESFVFLNVNGIVESREISLGSVYGGFVEVRDGLDSGVEVILDRTVVSGDKVESI